MEGEREGRRRKDGRMEGGGREEGVGGWKDGRKERERDVEEGGRKGGREDIYDVVCTIGDSDVASSVACTPNVQLAP
jgi:hypothetical protein